MPIHVNWENPDQTVMTIRYERPWTWAEFHHALDTMDSWMRQTDQRIHLIIDMRTAGLPPAGALPNFRRAASMKHVNRGELVIIGNSMLLRSFANMTAQVYGHLFASPDFTFVATPEEAHELLRTKDDGLNYNSP